MMMVISLYVREKQLFRREAGVAVVQLTGEALIRVSHLMVLEVMRGSE